MRIDDIGSDSLSVSRTSIHMDYDLDRSRIEFGRHHHCCQRSRTRGEYTFLHDLAVAVHAVCAELRTDLVAAGDRSCMDHRQLGSQKNKDCGMDAS